jgi:hypothetical protein
LFLGLIAVMAVIGGVIAFVRRKFYEEIRQKFVGRTIVRQSIGANFFGRTSKGMGQIRGNGALVLTPEQLYFVLFLPRTEITIPLESITKVSTPRSHLGKTIVSRLLRVDYRSAGGEDAIAWAVSDVDEWVSAIKRYKPHNR